MSVNDNADRDFISQYVDNMRQGMLTYIGHSYQIICQKLILKSS